MKSECSAVWWPEGISLYFPWDLAYQSSVSVKQADVYTDKLLLVLPGWPCYSFSMLHTILYSGMHLDAIVP